MENLEEKEEREEKPETEENSEKEETFFTKYYKQISLAWKILAGVIVLVGIFLFIYLIIPANRSQRAMNKADKYYAANDYENAARYYAKAFDAVGNNYDAYACYVLSKSAVSPENAVSAFEEAAGKLMSAPVAEDTTLAVDFFLLATEIYTENTERLIEILESAKAFLGTGFDAALSEAYLTMGLNTPAREYATAFDYFDKALELSDNSQSVKDAMTASVEEAVLSLIPYDLFADARSILDRYSSIWGSRKNELSDKIDLAEELFRSKNMLLEEVYTSMEGYASLRGYSLDASVKDNKDEYFEGAFTYDWSTMMETDGSSLAESVALASYPEPAAYAKDGFVPEFTGVAAAIYPYGEIYENTEGGSSVPYYFYFGNYSDGKRNGYGVAFIKTDVSSYKVYEGNWKDDKPDGFGALYEDDRYAYTSMARMEFVTYGNFTAGLFNGDMLSAALLNEYPDTYFAGAYTVTNGTAPALPGDLIDYGIIDEPVEGKYLYAVIKNVNEGDNFFIPRYQYKDSLLGVFGFR